MKRIFLVAGAIALMAASNARAQDGTVVSDADFLKTLEMTYEKDLAADTLYLKVPIMDRPVRAAVWALVEKPSVVNNTNEQGRVRSFNLPASVDTYNTIQRQYKTGAEITAKTASEQTAAMGAIADRMSDAIAGIRRGTSEYDDMSPSEVYNDLADLSKTMMENDALLSGKAVDPGKYTLKHLAEEVDRFNKEYDTTRALVRKDNTSVRIISAKQRVPFFRAAVESTNTRLKEREALARQPRLQPADKTRLDTLNTAVRKATGTDEQGNPRLRYTEPNAWDTQGAFLKAQKDSTESRDTPESLDQMTENEFDAFIDDVLKDVDFYDIDNEGMEDAKEENDDDDGDAI